MGPRSKPSKLDKDALWEYALRSLGRRAQSVSELRQKLLRRAAIRSDVDDVLVRLREYGYADDRKFSENFAAFRMQSQGFGRDRVLRDLRAKQVSETVAKQAVQGAYSGIDESELINNFVSRKYRGVNLQEFLKEPKNVNSMYRRLRMAGFNSSLVWKTLRQFSQALPEEWDDSAEQ